MSAHSMVHQRRRSGRRSALHRRRSSSPFSPCEESGKDRRRSNRQSIATISSVESVSTNSSTSILAPQLIAMSNHTIYLTNHIPTNTLKWSVRIGDIHLSVKRWWTDVYIYFFFSNWDDGVKSSSNMEVEALLSGGSNDEEQLGGHVALHKEVVGNMRYQPWPIGRKLRILRKAKLYVRQHEGVLQQRLAESRAAKDVFASARLLLTKVSLNYTLPLLERLHNHRTIIKNHRLIHLDYSDDQQLISILSCHLQINHWNLSFKNMILNTSWK